MDHKEKTHTIITGASSGLGFELARRCAKEGHTVFAVARRGDRLDKLLQICPKDSIIPIQADLSERSSVEFVVRYVLEKTGKIDILINNVGIGKTTNFEESTYEDIENTIKLNCIAAVYLTKLILPVMLKRRKGRIINISSTGGVTTLKHMAVYGATKHFINGFTKNLHRELKGTGVHVSAFMPGAMNTEFSFVASGIKSGGGESPEKVARAIFKKIKCSGPLLYPTFLSFLTVWFNRIMTILMLR